MAKKMHKIPKSFKDPVVAIPAVPLGERLQYCMNMLYVWGMMTEAEAFRVSRRIQKRRNAESKKAVPT